MAIARALSMAVDRNQRWVSSFHDVDLVTESAVCYNVDSGELVELANKPSDLERMRLWSKARRLADDLGAPSCPIVKNRCPRF
jgi:hypothetical protein